MNTRQFILAIASFCACLIGHAQTIGYAQASGAITFQWNGYSGSYIQTKDSLPFIVVHISNNEKYKAPDDPKPAIPEYKALEEHYRTMLGKRYLSISTYDSSAVELLTPFLTRPMPPGTNSGLFIPARMHLGRK